ncbi:3'-5' exonuclease [Ancylobacter sp. TS-1]|uniref:3'-5' exonuclease n=1 Tax=Ancylobacter sp. TS-1 TaxID=1850374 RepID=UPI001265B928|nr:3'-5' exonuclease [Ancylobacter sp. TS-1]QFR34411.1 AAA family ATPase [Ancylobacter sp. TS-1]
MTLLYASTFTKALGRLSAAEQKQVKISTVDLALDPTGNGLQLHRVEAAPGFWTARVSQDIRLVLHMDGARTLIAYVGHHDDAYRWAERRRLVPHERTGAMQFVEIVERTEEIPLAFAPVTEAVAAPAVLPANRPFAQLTDDQLLDVGVPRDWLETVRAADVASVDGLFARLPDEAAEALLDVATGGRLEDHVALRAPPGADPFAHPDAQRRFRTVEGLEELKAALDAPFEQWAVFLHPTQRALVEKAWSGPARVSGSAGTGKTIVALHRAAHLAHRPGAHVLLTSFSPALAEALQHKVDLLAGASGQVRARVTVAALDQVAYALHTDAFGAVPLADTAAVQGAVEAARRAGHGDGHSAGFLIEEWEEVVDAWQIDDVASYAAVPRLGRKTRLGQKQREAAWMAFAVVRNHLRQAGLVTWADIYARLTRRMLDGYALPYTHLVVDEAQDLSVAQVRFLAAAGGARPDALFLTGDLGQRIFHLPFSWAKLGLDIRGRSQVLKVCYRTSHQIRSLADRLLNSTIIDQDGVGESRRGTVSVFDGPEPSVRLFARVEEEIAAVGAWIREGVAGGIKAEEQAILVRGADQMNRAQAARRAAGADVAILAMHDAKGLEFRAVAVMALDEDVLPDPQRLAAVGDVADLEAIQETERHLLYVATTRARDRLMLSGIAPGCEFLDDVDSSAGRVQFGRM